MSTRFNITEIKEISDLLLLLFFYYRDIKVYNHGRPKDGREQNQYKMC